MWPELSLHPVVLIISCRCQKLILRTSSICTAGDSEASACGKLEKGRKDEETRFVQVADAIDPK